MASLDYKSCKLWGILSFGNVLLNVAGISNLVKIKKVTAKATIGSLNITLKSTCLYC